jgi:hypothetical protein
VAHAHDALWIGGAHDQQDRPGRELRRELARLCQGEIADRPRALSVPWPLGFPLGAPGDAKLQRAVLLRLLGLLGRDDVPLIESF